MKVKLPTEEKPIEEERVDGPGEDPNQDDLPSDNEDAPVETEDAGAEDSKASELELENARLKGKLEGISESAAKPAPGTSQDEKDAAIKNACMADMSALDDDSFQTKYRMTKIQANSAIHDFEINKERTKNAGKIAELEVKSDLSSKYPTFAKNFEKIKSNVLADLSPEAKQDPVRLKRAMEREFLLLEKENPSPAKKSAKEDPTRRRIVNDFEKPNRDQDRKEDRGSANKDELDPALAAVGKRFGITSETQRKKFMSPFIPMDLGGGVKFEDPNKGFEKVASK